MIFRCMTYRSGVYLGMDILVTNGCWDKILSRTTMTSSGGGCKDLRSG